MPWTEAVWDPGALHVEANSCHNTKGLLSKGLVAAERLMESIVGLSEKRCGVRALLPPSWREWKGKLQAEAISFPWE